MSRRCGMPLGSGLTCLHPVSDPTRFDCGRHRNSVGVIPRAPDRHGCSMYEDGPRAWRCHTHAFHTPEWEAAIALGAKLPCRIPLPDKEREKIAGGRKLDVHTLRLLATDPRVDVRIRLAANGVAPSTILSQMAADRNRVVRARVASHRNTPANTLMRLATDSHPDVRCWVAVNPNTPLAALLRLAEDPAVKVRYQLVRHAPTVPNEVLEKVAADANENEVLRASARARLRGRAAWRRRGAGKLLPEEDQQRAVAP